MKTGFGLDQLELDAQWMCACFGCSLCLNVQVWCWAFLQTIKLKTRRPSTDKKTISSFLLVFLSLFPSVVSKGTVCEIRRARSTGHPRPVVSLVPVVRLLSNMWRRGYVQGALLHQPEVYTHTLADITII